MLLSLRSSNSLKLLIRFAAIIGGSRLCTSRATSGRHALRLIGAAFAAAMILIACERGGESHLRDGSRRHATAREIAGPQRAKDQNRVGPAPVPDPRPLNFLIVVLDTLRFDATSLGAKGGPQTPFLKRVAEAGVNFTSAYSTFDSTPPSHFSVLTGFQHGLHTALDAPEASLPFQLGQLGYSSFGISANGNLSQKFHPFLRSFGRFTSLQEAWEALSPSEKAARLVTVDRRILEYGGRLNDWNRLFVHSSADEVISRFEKEIARTNSPFFGFLNLLDCHDPYFPDPRLYSWRSEEGSFSEPFDSDLRFRDLPPFLTNPNLIEDAKQRAIVQAAVAKADTRAWSTTFDLRREQIARYRQRYEAEVRELDRHLRRIFNVLRNRGLASSTVVVITSDHGEAFGDENLITHSFDNRSAWEATHHVPLVVSLPPHVPRLGSTVTKRVTIADIAPTIYDLARVDWRPLATRAGEGNFGQSFIQSLNHVPVVYEKVVLTQWTTPSDAALEREKREARERLRGLGYVQ